MSAREIIARIRFKPLTGYTSSLGFPMADEIFDQLTAAGYRILAPDQIDDETLELAAQHLERQPSFGDGKWAARHVRALKKAGEQ